MSRSICMFFSYVSSLCLAANGFTSPRASSVNTEAKESLRIFAISASSLILFPSVVAKRTNSGTEHFFVSYI